MTWKFWTWGKKKNTNKEDMLVLQLNEALLNSAALMSGLRALDEQLGHLIAETDKIFVAILESMDAQEFVFSQDYLKDCEERVHRLKFEFDDNKNLLIKMLQEEEVAQPETGE